MVSRRQIIVVGGGAAGFFGAIACAEASSEARVTLLERGPSFLSKVRISGGGRCNVTHACFDPREFATRYPRGDRALISVLQRFSAADTVAWFEQRGVQLKTEADGRMFPTTDSSQTIIDCLQRAAREAAVETRANCGVEHVARADDGFTLALSSGQSLAGRMRQLRVWGSRERLFEPALKRLSLATLREALACCTQIDRIVKGLRTAQGPAMGDARLRRCSDRRPNALQRL